MILNAVLAACIELVLAAIAYWALGFNGDGALARFFPGKMILQQMLALLLPWLAGISCVQVGYRLRELTDGKKNLLSAGWLVLVALLAAVFSLGRLAAPLKALALPFVPLLTILGLPYLWPWYGLLAVFAPLLLLAGLFIRSRKRRQALSIIIPYLGLLLLLPVIGLMLSML